jgi:hypothetical protein
VGPETNHPHRRGFLFPDRIQSADGLRNPQIPMELELVGKVVVQYLCGFGDRLLRCRLIHFLFLVNSLVKGSLISGDGVSGGGMHPQGVLYSGELLQHRDDRGREGRKAKIRKPQTQVQPISHHTILSFPEICPAERNGR